MSALVKLNLKTVKRVTEVDPVTARRDRLVAGLDEQLAGLAAAVAGKTHTVEVKRAVRNAEGLREVVTVLRQVRAWHFAQDGGYYVQCRYGTRVLMLHGNASARQKLSTLKSETGQNGTDAGRASCVAEFKARYDRSVKNSYGRLTKQYSVIYSIAEFDGTGAGARVRNFGYKPIYPLLLQISETFFINGSISDIEGYDPWG